MLQRLDVVRLALVLLPHEQLCRAVFRRRGQSTVHTCVRERGHEGECNASLAALLAGKG